MSAIFSLRQQGSRSAQLANRLWCSARLMLAGERANRVRLAAEILESAPEHRLTGSEFTSVYQTLGSLYIQNSLFETARQSPDFDNRDLAMFRLAFEQVAQIDIPHLNPLVTHYLETIGRDCSQENRPVQSQEEKDFFAFCRQTKNQKQIGRRRNELVLSWLTAQAPAPAGTFYYPTGTNSLHPPLLFKQYEYNHSVSLTGLYPVEGERGYSLRFRDKQGDRLVYVYNEAGTEFLGKQRLRLLSDGRITAEPLTLSTTQLNLALNRLVVSWLGNEVKDFALFFLYPIDSTHAISLLNTPNRCNLTSVPFSEWAIIRFIDRNDNKVAQVFSPEDLSKPVAEYLIFNDSGGLFRSKRITLTRHQRSLERNQLALAWMQNKEPAPQQPLVYQVTEQGTFVLTSSGGKQLSITGVKEYFLAVPFSETEINGYATWFTEPPGRPGQYYFNAGTDRARIAKAKDKTLQALWQKASAIQVQLIDEPGEQQIEISQLAGGLPSRRFKIELLADGTGKATAIDESYQQTLQKRLRLIRQYYLEAGPVPTGEIELPVRRNGSVDILTNTPRVTLQALAKCNKFPVRKLADFKRKYGRMFTVKGDLAWFRIAVGPKEIAETKDQKLIALWKKSHRALLLFREEKKGKRKKSLVKIQHAETREEIAEFEIVKQPDGSLTPVRRQTSWMKAVQESAAQFTDWLINNGHAPKGDHPRVTNRGEVTVLRGQGHRLVLPIGVATLPKTELTISAAERQGEQLLYARHAAGEAVIEREFRIIKTAPDLEVEETPASLARVAALPADLRDQFTRAIKKPRPVEKPGPEITRQIIAFLKKLRAPSPNGFDLRYDQIEEKTGISGNLLSAIYNEERPGTTKVLAALKRAFARVRK
ncbi:MAG: hypothetical protein ABIE84_00280 [bacterium]